MLQPDPNITNARTYINNLCDQIIINPNHVLHKIILDADTDEGAAYLHQLYKAHPPTYQRLVSILQHNWTTNKYQPEPLNTQA